MVRGFGLPGRVRLEDDDLDGPRAENANGSQASTQASTVTDHSAKQKTRNKRLFRTAYTVHSCPGETQSPDQIRSPKYVAKVVIRNVPTIRQTGQGVFLAGLLVLQFVDMTFVCGRAQRNQSTSCRHLRSHSVKRAEGYPSTLISINGCNRDSKAPV